MLLHKLICKFNGGFPTGLELWIFSFQLSASHWTFRYLTTLLTSGSSHVVFAIRHPRPLGLLLELFLTPFFGSHLQFFSTLSQPKFRIGIMAHKSYWDLKIHLKIFPACCKR